MEEDPKEKMIEHPDSSRSALWTRPKRRDSPVEQEAGDEAQPRRGPRRPLVVLLQAPEARSPRGGTPYNLPARQQHDSLLRARVLDHLRPDAAVLGLGC